MGASSCSEQVLPEHQMVECSPLTPIDLLRGQCIDVDIVQAPQIDDPHFIAVRCLAVAERMNAARRAEDVMGDFLVELVILEHFFARQKLELVCRNEREQIPCFAAYRAVAGNSAFEAHGDFATHGAAMATASVGFDFRRVRHNEWFDFVRLHGGFVAQVRPVSKCLFW